LKHKHDCVEGGSVGVQEFVEVIIGVQAKLFSQARPAYIYTGGLYIHKFSNLFRIKTQLQVSTEAEIING